VGVFSEHNVFINVERLCRPIDGVKQLGHYVLLC